MAQNKLDEDFVTMLITIEQQYDIFNRHIQIRIEKWVEELVKFDENIIWKKSRNFYLHLLYEMVNRRFIGSLFLKMPPSNGIPTLKEQQYKAFLQQIKNHSQLPPPCHPLQLSTKTNKNVKIQKINELIGDNTYPMTPNCQTNRSMQSINNVRNTGTNFPKILGERREIVNIQLLKKVSNFLQQHQIKFEDDKEFKELCVQIEDKINDQCDQLTVEEGVERNNVLFQFGSPRGMTQMTYFKETLQL